MKHPGLLALVLLAAAFALAADTNPAATALRERADRISAQLEDDAPGLPDLRGAFVFVRMADAWKKADPQRARGYLEKAVRLVSSAGKAESDEHLAQRLDTGSHLLDIIADTDPKLALQFGHALAEQVVDMPRSSSMQLRGARQRLGFGLRNLSMKLTQMNLDGSASIVGDLIRLRDGNDLPWAIADVAFRDPGRADQLYAQAAADARSDFDFEMLFGLVQLPFPYSPRGQDPPGISSSMKTEAANLLAAFMLRPMDTFEQRRDVCRAAGIGAIVLPSLPPDIASPVSNAIQQCKSTPTMESKAFDTGIQPADSIEGNLRLAESASNLETRAEYKIYAAGLALSSNQSQRALEILHDMSDDERTASHGRFEISWSSNGGIALSELARKHERQAADRILEQTPDALRAELQIVYGRAIAKDDPEVARLMAAQALRTIEKYPPEDDRTYATLLKLYSTTAPEDALLALRTVVAALNGRKEITEEEFRRRGYRSTSITERMEPLRGAGNILLKMDESTADAFLHDINAPPYRAIFRLGLLYAVLDAYGEQSQKPQPPSPPKPAADKAKP